jgi:hypothetical protein
VPFYLANPIQKQLLLLDNVIFEIRAGGLQGMNLGTDDIVICRNRSATGEHPGRLVTQFQTSFTTSMEPHWSVKSIALMFTPSMISISECGAADQYRLVC